MSKDKKCHPSLGRSKLDNEEENISEIEDIIKEKIPFENR